VRDLVCTEAELGKPAGHDMLEGTYTLPVIRALADPVAGPELSPLLGRPLDGPELDKARSIILSTDAIKESLAEGRRWADVAAQALDAMSFPSGPLPSGPLPSGTLPSGPLPSGPVPVGSSPSGPVHPGPASESSNNGAGVAVGPAREALGGLAHRLLDDLVVRAG
jgi:heptaprenyl diphosphate synthase